MDTFGAFLVYSHSSNCYYIIEELSTANLEDNSFIPSYFKLDEKTLKNILIWWFDCIHRLEALNS